MKRNRYKEKVETFLHFKLIEPAFSLDANFFSFLSLQYKMDLPTS